MGLKASLPLPPSPARCYHPSTCASVSARAWPDSMTWRPHTHTHKLKSMFKTHFFCFPMFAPLTLSPPSALHELAITVPPAMNSWLSSCALSGTRQWVLCPFSPASPPALCGNGLMFLLSKPLSSPMCRVPRCRTSFLQPSLPPWHTPCRSFKRPHYLSSKPHSLTLSPSPSKPNSLISFLCDSQFPAICLIFTHT